MLKTSASKDIQVTIPAVFETHAVPVAAALTERYVMTEEDWERAELPDTKLPTIDKTSISNTLMLQLVKEITKFQTKLPTWDGTWEAPLIFKVLSLSTRNCKRWSALFLKKFGLSLPEGETLPALPLSPGLLKELLEEYPELIAAGTFNQLKDFVMVNLSPPADIAEINKQIMDNNNDDSPPTVNWETWKTHWRDIYRQINPHQPASSSSLFLTPSEAANLLIKPASHWALHRGITIPMIQHFLYEIADALIEGSNHAALSRLITQFTTLDVANLPNTKFNLEEAAEAIAANAFPLIGRIVALIDFLCTDAW